MSGSNSSDPVAAPLQSDPVALTVHSLPDPASMAKQRAGRWRMLMVVAVCAAPVIASYFSFYVLKLSGRAYGDLITPTVDMPPELMLRDESGKPVTTESLKGQWLLTVVQPGACGEACERKLFMQRQLREMLGKDRDKLDKVWLVPDDQPLSPQLRDAVTQTPAVTVLRAPRAELEAWLKPADGHALADHLFLVDPMGRWMWRAPADPDPAKVKNDLNKLLKAAAGWDKAGR